MAGRKELNHGGCIRIRMDNAAFEDDSSIELSRILLELSETVANGPEISVDFSTRLRDLNGNDVGYLMVNQ